MGRDFYSLTPKEVPHVETPYRKIATKLPVPESVEILKKLRTYEPHGMQAVPPVGVLWDHAKDCSVFDKYGNKWLDWSSGVLVASAGHSREEIKDAIKKQVDSDLLFTYLFPHEMRLRLIEKLMEITPKEWDMALLLSSGAEATERAFKLARSYGRKVGGDKKIGMVTFKGGFHGRSMGSQTIGGIPALKEWIVNLDPSVAEVPFPGDLRTENKDFSLFEETLEKSGVKPDQIAGVIFETFQGGNAAFMPKEYAQKLRAWCDKHDVVLILDEVQAGFGRTGKMFGFEHYDIVPDLITCGKATTSSLPLSIVLGKSKIMNITDPVSSTHTGNPVCVAAALANIDVIIKDKLVDNAATVGAHFKNELEKIQSEYPDIVGSVDGEGLVFGMSITQKGSMEPDGMLAFNIVQTCVEKGVLMFSPVGTGGATIKICPPLTITKEAVDDGVSALREAFKESVS